MSVVAVPPLIAEGPAPVSSARDASVGGAIRLSAEIVVRLSSIVATLWLTRSLGVTAFGDFLLALSMGLMIADLCDLGLNIVIVPQVVRDPSNLRAILRTKAFATLLVLMACAVLVPAAAWISGVAPLLIALCTFHFFGASWIDAVGASLRALGRRVDEAILLLVFRATLVTLVLVSPFGLTVRGSSIGYAIAVVPALFTSVILLRRPFHALPVTRTDARAILHSALPMGVNSYLAIVSTRVELFLLQATFGPQAVGLFGGALRIVESLLTLPSAIAAGALPAVSRDVVHGSRGAAQRTFGLVVWIAAPCAAGIALCAPGILGVLGPGFVEAAPALRVLSIALFVCFSNAALSHILIAAADTKTIPRLTALRVSAAIVAGLILIPRFGAIGAAMSFTISEVLLLAALLRRVRAHVPLDFLRPALWAFAACVPMAVALPLLSLSLPLSIALGGLLFVVSAALVLRRGTASAGLA